MIFSDTRDDDGKAIFSMSFSTNVLTVMEEEYVYPLDSFIAEFGGALGLPLMISLVICHYDA